MNFLAELKRRNVIRMAGLYLVGAWLIVQVADTLLPVFEAPEWVMKVLVGLLALGFVPTLIFSWVFELTPEGLKRENEIDRSQSISDVTARRLDIAVIVLLLIVGALMLRGPSTSTESAATPVASAAMEGAPSEAQISDKSIAVLPFADFSPAAIRAGLPMAWPSGC